ncbi:MAG: relaxase/mobilization nuclease domain-containing protein [Lachnospiraceae bacterium]|nr:relaxase/mobilization nuclease domain-containing protein [Lachnospiraceae bacterium]
MSILKFVNGKNRGVYALRKSITYVLNPEKTKPYLKGGYGVNLETASRDMETVQHLFGKTSGRRYIHYVLSFDKGVSENIVYQLAEVCTSYYADFQSVWEIHTNTENLHIHVIMNSVNFRTGAKYSQSKAELQQFKNYLNSVLESYGLNTIGPQMMELEFDEDYIDDFLEYEENYDEDYEEITSSSNSFFSVDEDEQEQIEECERYDYDFKQASQFFEGREHTFPDMNEEYAFLAFQAWKENDLEEE